MTKQASNQKLSKKQDHFTLINEITYKEDTEVVNIYALNVCTPNFTKQTLLDIEAQIDSNTIAVSNFSISISPVN
jgi:hypothetical protein